jgi:hypothetical protein
MFAAAVNVVNAPADFTKMPIVLESRSSRTSAVLMMILLLPALAALLVPISLVAAQASDAAVVVSENLVATAQLGVGLIIWTLLFVLPIARLITSFGMRRRVHIENGLVTLIETGPMSRFAETKPLKSYDGIVHVMRTSLSGVHHELMLVNRGVRGGIVFHRAERIGPETIARAAATLGLPVLPSAELRHAISAIRIKTNAANDRGPVLSPTLKPVLNPVISTLPAAA